MAQPDFDLVVAGAGGGVVGALRAAELGARVLLIDADEHFHRGNNTSMCTAMIPAPGTRWQQAAGVEDSPEQFVADIMDKTHQTADATLADALAAVGAPLVTWLADSQGLEPELVREFRYPGHSADRCHTFTGRHGSHLLGHLVESARRQPNIELITPMRLIDVTSEGAQVQAVQIVNPDGVVEEVSTPAVLLATNGYGANRDLVRTWMPEIADAHYHGGQYSLGDALRIGEALGGKTAFLDAYQGHAALSSRTQTLVGWATVLHGGIIVNSRGHRFAPESIGYSEFAALLAQQPGSTGWIVIDEHIADLCSVFEDFRTVADNGGVVSADSIEELAAKTSLPVDTLTDQVQAASRAASGEAPDPQGRNDSRHPLAPPYRAIQVMPALFHTQGGLVVDGSARVLDADDETIRGLYASGGAAMGISGHGAAGYLAGNGLIAALGLAFLAAEHVASTLPT